MDSGPSTTLPTEEEMIKQILLLSTYIWDNRVDKKDIDLWLSNFTGAVFDLEYERRLALFLLSNFVYYNEREVKHLCKVLFRDLLHYFISSKQELFNNYKDAIENILSVSRFYHLGRPGESGAYLLYYFRQENELGVNVFISNITKIHQDVENIILLDDVTVTGEQADFYVRRIASENPEINKKNKILLTFISTNEAKEVCERNKINLISCISLDKRCKCFSPESIIFHHYKDHHGDCMKLVEYYGQKLDPEHPFGYNNGQFAFGFYYNIPDNVLPVFWSNQNGWRPILKRYPKIHPGTSHGEYGRFV